MVRLAFLTATLVLLKGTSSVTAAAHPPMQKEPRAAPADGHDLLLDTFATYDAPGAAFPAISHPFLPVYADDHGSDSRKNTVPTNAWHSNLFYSSAENLAPTITDPYILRFLDGYGGNPGLSIHQGADKVIGEYPAVNDVPATQAGYMINSVVVDMRLTCAEWANERPEMKVTSWDALTANVRLASPSAASHIDFPLARGMAYVTALYQDLTPNFFTQHAIIEVTADGQSTQDTFTGTRFRLRMNDPQGSVFLIYALGNQPLTLTRSGMSNLVASTRYTGPIRIAKVPGGQPQAEEVLDKSSGIWATAGQVTASSSSNAAAYTLQWQTDGSQSQPLLTYAYAHHLQTLDDTTRSTNIVLDASTKGPMTAVLGSQWTLNEPELVDVDWLPPNPKVPETAVVNEIMSALEKDVASNYTNATLKEDNYFSGKGLQKFAMVALVLNRPDQTGLRNPELAAEALNQLKAAFLPYLHNKQEDPFSYDNVYRGVVARSGLPQEMGGTGDVNAGFGHSYYSDHHYHHGYFVVTAAIIHYLDPDWMTEDIKRWTEVMIRDVNAPEEDPYFAPFRNWDWFAGHSWAGGIKVNGALDGRDQESIPEALNFYYGMRLWALATQNEALRDLASLQLTIMKRTTYEYFWMLDSNKNRPQSMIKNKVVGIFFEHKIDYTTYFGRYLEFIHGIQQLPMTPALAAFRTPEFVAEEWEQKLASVAPSVRSSWAGVLYLNYALIDSTNAYAKLRKVGMDDGQTRSYSMYLAATQPQFRKKVKAAHLPSGGSNSTDQRTHKASLDDTSLFRHMRIFRPFQRHYDTH